MSLPQKLSESVMNKGWDLVNDLLGRRQTVSLLSVQPRWQPISLVIINILFLMILHSVIFNYH